MKIFSFSTHGRKNTDKSRKIFRSLWNFYEQKVGIITIPILLLLVSFTILQPRFGTISNLLTVLRQGSFLAIAACAQMIVILTAGLDLSVGSTIALAGVIATSVSLLYGTYFGYLSGFITGCIVGFVNGSIIAFGGVPPFIVTLSMMSIASGMALTLTGGTTVFGLPVSFAVIGAGYVGPIPVPILLAAMIFFLTWVFLNKMRYGRNLYAMGGNLEAARLSGITIKKHLILAYSVSGFLNGINGVALASRANSGPPTLGAHLTLASVAAACIGGVSLFGGVGKVSGVIWGVFLLSFLSNGFDLLNVSSYNQMIIIGGIIILAVAFNAYKKN